MHPTTMPAMAPVVKPTEILTMFHSVWRDSSNFVTFNGLYSNRISCLPANVFDLQGMHVVLVVFCKLRDFENGDEGIGRIRRIRPKWIARHC